MKKNPQEKDPNYSPSEDEKKEFAQSSAKQGGNYKNKPRRRWTPEQNIRYAQFLQQNIEIFKCTQLRRQETVFVNLSKHMKTRSPLQAKSHHQKMIKGHTQEEKIIEYILSKYGATNVDRISEGQQKGIKRGQKQVFQETYGPNMSCEDQIINAKLPEDQNCIRLEGQIDESLGWLQDI